MATGIRNYDTVANNNTDIAGVDIDEGMAMNLVNNAMRAMSAELKKLLNDISGKLVSGGAADVQTLTSESALTAYSDGVHFTFIAGFTNTGATTLNVNAIGAKKVLKGAGTALAAGDITAGMWCGVSYDASADGGNGAWMLVAPNLASIISAAGAATLTNKTIDAASNTISNLAVSMFAAAAIVTEAEGIASSDNDTSIPTSAAVHDYIVGQHTIWIPAGAMKARTTNGAAFGTEETGTNDIPLDYWAFDATTEEGVGFNFPIPASWDLGNLEIRVWWKHPATVTNFGVAWGIRAMAIGDATAIDNAYGTEQVVTDTGGTTGSQYRTSAITNLAVGNTPASGELTYFEVTREVGNASDNMAVDAHLLGVQLKYNTNTPTD